MADRRKALLHGPPRDGGGRETRLALLGGFELTSGGEAVSLSPNAQRLLALLAFYERPLQRHYVAGVLWPETADQRASASLRTTVWQTRRSCPEALEVVGQHLAIGKHVMVDTVQVSSWARAVVKGEFGDSGALPPHALSGELLPGWYEDFVVVERERLRQLRSHALEMLCERLSAGGSHVEAVEMGLAAVHLEPLRESAHRALIGAYLAEGNHHEALRQYEAFRELLWSDLGLEPSPHMRALVHSLVTAGQRAD